MASGIATTVVVSNVNLKRLQRGLRDTRPLVGRIGLFGLRHSNERLRNRIQNPERSKNELLRSGHTVIDSPTKTTLSYNTPYARIQMLGGEIRAKGHPYLAMPVPDWLAKARTWPRDWAKGELKFVRRVQINFLGSTWYGPALVKATKSVKAQKQWLTEETKLRHAALRAKETKALGFVRKFTKEKMQAELTSIRHGAKLARKDSGKSGDVEAGDVMYALVRKVRIPGDDWRNYDEPWNRFTHDAINKHLGFAA